MLTKIFGLFILWLTTINTLQYAHGIDATAIVLKEEMMTTVGKVSNQVSEQLSKVDKLDDAHVLRAEAPVVGDSRFLAALNHLRSQVYQPPKRWLQQFHMVLDAAKSQPSRTASLRRRISWRPVRCKDLGLKKWKFLQTLQDDGPKHNTVHLVEGSDGTKYVLKTFKKYRSYTAEVALLQLTATHPHIVKAVCYDSVDRRPALVMEWIDGGDTEALAEVKNGGTEADLVRWSAQLLSTLAYIHRLGFIHGDLKPGNVLVRRSDRSIVLIDFGYAVTLPIKPGLHRVRGQPVTRAPEISHLIGNLVHEASDWWAYGATVSAWWACYHGYHPTTLTTIKNGGRWKVHRVPSWYNNNLRQLLYLTLDPNPENRRFNKQSTLGFLKGLEYFAGVKWED